MDEIMWKKVRQKKDKKRDEVRKRKVGARLSPSNLPPPSLWSEFPSVASCCGAERR